MWDERSIIIAKIIVINYALPSFFNKAAMGVWLGFVVFIVVGGGLALLAFVMYGGGAVYNKAQKCVCAFVDVLDVISCLYEVETSVIISRFTSQMAPNTAHTRVFGF